MVDEHRTSDAMTYEEMLQRFPSGSRVVVYPLSLSARFGATVAGHTATRVTVRPELPEDVKRWGEYKTVTVRNLEARP